MTFCFKIRCFTSGRFEAVAVVRVAIKDPSRSARGSVHDFYLEKVNWSGESKPPREA